MHTKKFTILHSNDMHGDFLSEVREGKGNLIGGLALLSGYLNKVRREEENVLYVISGDMLQGSLIDSEYKGISTIEIMNYLSPDVVCVGNHEVDYGLPHLLFLEKMANFPIVNANLYIKKYHKRIMNPYVILKKAGFEILFTGIITEKIMDSIKLDNTIGTFVTLEEASKEVGIITNAYKNDDIDLTVLLTHIGFEEDKKLAKILRKEWGVDMIIGGHSHTILEKPAKINNILIAQAGVGTDQIGRFDITVDDDTNGIIDYKWQLIPINNKLAEPDNDLQDYIDKYKRKVDQKYNSLLCKFSIKLTHPKREVETSLGNLFADIIAEMAPSDIVLIGSGSIRSKELGPLVTLGDFMACFPYDDALNRFTVSGNKLKAVFNYIMRNENRDGEGENYQVNKAVKAVHNDKRNLLFSLKINGKEIKDNDKFTLCIQGYHFKNCKNNLGLSEDELLEGGNQKVVSTSIQEVLVEYLRNNQNITSKVEGRLEYS